MTAAIFECMALSAQEREQFLAEPHTGSLAVAWTNGRAPMTVPIWYHYSPGEELWISTGAQSRKAEAIRAAGRFSLLAQRIEPTVRYVSVEGPVTRIEAGSEEASRRMAERYLPPKAAANFVEYERTELGEHVTIYMRPEHWLSAEMGSF